MNLNIFNFCKRSVCYDLIDRRTIIVL